MPAVLITAAVLLIGALIGLLAVYNKVYYSPYKSANELEPPTAIGKHPYQKESREMIKELSELPCEFISTRSYDGLKLSARYYKGEEGKPICLCFHGYRGSAVRDLSGGGLFLIHEGCSVILVDERAHWRSEGHTITYGVRERFDVVSWLSYICERFGSDAPVFIFGISMGGGTVLMASGLELPGSVRGISADCPFSSPMDIILHVCRKMGLVPALCRPLVWMSAAIFGRFNVSSVNAAEEVKKAKVPIMIIHGEGDNFVPMYMSREVEKANPKMVEYHSFPDAGHGLSYLYDTPRYQAIVRDFIAKHTQSD